MSVSPELKSVPSSRGVLAPVLDFLSRHEPFKRMTAAHLEFAAKRMNLIFYAAEETVLEPAMGPVKALYLVKQGRIAQEPLDRQGHVMGAARELDAGSLFSLGALASRRPVRSRYRATEDSFCLVLDAQDFNELSNLSGVFRDFCSRRLAGLVDQLLTEAQSRAAIGMPAETTLGLTIAERMREQPLTCPPNAALHAVLSDMYAHKSDAVVVIDAEQRPIGIFTLHDLLSRVTLVGKSLQEEVRSVMTTEPLSLPSNALALEAATLMARHGMHHVCIIERGRLKGLLAEQDLFSSKQLDLVKLSLSIEHCRSIDELAELSRSVQQLMGQLLLQSLRTDQVMPMLSTLNDHISRRAISLLTEVHDGDLPQFDWLSFGSEGRREQTLLTDQDNGIIFTPGRGSLDASRQILVRLATRINDALRRCGFALCRGQVMASNPEYCLTADEWRQKFARYMDGGSPADLLKANTFFDLRVLHGREGATEDLRQWFLHKTAMNSRFRRQMAENALRLRPPLNWLGDFKLAQRDSEHGGVLDLKVNGVTPVTDAARIYALAIKCPATHTEARLEACVAEGIMNEQEVSAWTKAYRYMQRLRLHRQLRRQQAGQPMDNYVDPAELDQLQKHTLKEAFRQARRLQSRLALDYQL